MIVDRNILHENFTWTTPFERYDRGGLCKQIDLWKRFLRSQHVEKGDQIGFALTTIDVKYLALFFAICEIGGVIVILDWNRQLTEDSLRFARLAPIKLYLHESLISDSAEFYRKFAMLPINVDEVDLAIYDYEDHGDYPIVNPSDLLVVCTSSGTTGSPKRIEHTHGFMAKLLARNTVLFEGRTTALHFHSLHHGSSLATYFLPSLAACERHIGRTSVDPSDLLVECSTHGVDCIQFPYPSLTNEFLVRCAETRYKIKNLRVFTLSYIDPSWQDHLGRGVEDIISLFGSSETSGPVLIGRCARDEPFDPKVFSLMDDFYEIIHDKGFLTVERADLKSFTLPDFFIKIAERVYRHKGREYFMRIDDVVLDINRLNAYLENESMDGSFVIDEIAGKIYLVFWGQNTLKTDANHAYENINQAIKKEYGRIRMSGYAILERDDFMAGIKVDAELLREYFRERSRL